jgi:hypothetical protein
MLAAQSSPVSGFVFVVAVLATSIVLVAALAWVSRQLLGLPVGTLRSSWGRRCWCRAGRGQGRWRLSAACPGEGGVTFTKLGQLLSTRRDLLPEEFISELAQLQDRAEPAPWEQVEEVIAQSLGTPGQVFAELQQEPAAAASIAQVHKARLRRDGGVDAEVAVKVQRPGIRATVEQETWTSCSGWRSGSSAAPAGRVRSARPAWPVDSPLPCGKNPTSGWRPATRLPWPLRGRVSSGPSGAALR